MLRFAFRNLLTRPLRSILSLLGLTVGCAECHTHKYDPISHVDYYRFRAIFEPALDWKNWRAPRNRLVSLATAGAALVPA